MDSDQRQRELIDKLSKTGCRLTPQRVMVIKILSHSQTHPSVEEIYQLVRAEFPMTSLGTVYKTVELLREMGEILELGFAHHSSRYDGTNPVPHPHLICIKCETIVDPELNMLDNLAAELSNRTGYQIVQHRLDFYGICPDCLSKQAERVE